MPTLRSSDIQKIQRLLHWQRKVAQPLERVIGKQRRTRRPRNAVRTSTPGYQQLFKCTPDVDLEPNTTGPCTVVGGKLDGETIYVTFDWIDEEKISSGKEVIVGRFKDEEPLTPDPGNGQTKVYRPISAECEDPPPPDSAQIYSDNDFDSDTNNWGPIPGAVLDFEFGQGYTTDTSLYGFEVHEPGYWEIAFRFTFEGLANNMTLGIRTITEAGVGVDLSYPIRQADTTTSGSISTTAAVTQAEIDAAQVFLVIHRNTSAAGNWISTELDLKRLGYAVPV